MGVPWIGVGGRMNVTGQVEIAEGELVWEQVSRMRENGPSLGLKMVVGEVLLDWMRLLEASLLRASISHEREQRRRSLVRM